MFPKPPHPAKNVLLFFAWIVGVIAIIAGVRACRDQHTSVLWRAARDGDGAEVKRLVELGADVNERKGRFYDTALHVAAGKGSLDVVAYLLSKGADVNARDESGLTPLHAAARYPGKGGPPAGSEAARNQIAAMLIEHGADVRAVGSDGLTPLHLAAQEDNVWLVESLLTRGVDPNAPQAQGMTPFHFAAFHGHDNPAMAALFIKFKADPNQKDQDGKSPLDYATEYEPQFAAVLKQSATGSSR
jgi:ankyrin repeat protein